MPTFDKSYTTEDSAQQFSVEGNQYDTGPLHQNVTIETLPDDALLAIFASYLDLSDKIDVWRTLVHVCQRWRYLVFASPGHLNLRLECSAETRTRDMLRVWPPLPIVITDDFNDESCFANVIAALKQRDRVCKITLDDIPVFVLDKFVPAMLGPFPALECITFVADGRGSRVVVVPDSFLGGSAPQLRWLRFDAISFPALPTLLSSTSKLVDLQLWDIPRSGYISPEVMVTCLSAMRSLRNLDFHFNSPQSFPNCESRGHPPLARSTLPALRNLNFEGINEYFEDLIARIDTPMIRRLEITFFQRHFYDFSQLSQFIGHVEVFNSPDHATMWLINGPAVSVRIGTVRPMVLQLGIRCKELHLQLQYFLQIYSSSSLAFSNVESLAISCMEQLQHPQSIPTVEDFLWLDLLRPFTAVKNLNMDKNSLALFAYTLKQVAKEGIMEIFPAIRELSTGEHLPSGSILRAIEKFTTARGLFTRLDHPHRWVAG